MEVVLHCKGNFFSFSPFLSLFAHWLACCVRIRILAPVSVGNRGLEAAASIGIAKKPGQTAASVVSRIRLTGSYTGVIINYETVVTFCTNMLWSYERHSRSEKTI